MKRLLLLLIVQLSLALVSKAQIGKTFWFAAPEVTVSHTGGDAAEIRVSTFDSAATVRIYQPANPAGVDFTLNVPANSSVVQSLAGFANDVETRPFDQILSKGLLIESDVDVTAYYEVVETNNTDIFALKSNNALGTEFYVPLQNIWPNQPFTGAGQTNAYSQFSIVATEDNTTIWILPSVAIFNHAAKIPYKITLNKGESYSGRATGTAALLHPVGTIISSDKPVAVTYADDSVRPSGFGCYDLYGDQLVPTNIIGQEYIVNSNDANLNPPELVLIVATQNNTQIQKNGVDKATLFNGQFLIDTVTSTSYYKGNKPYYLIQITGFGCEIGSAILPPLNCAGSDQVSFGRSSTTGLSFFLSILIRSGSEDGFSINGNTTLITAADFTPVPGTGGEWVTMFKSFTEVQIPRGAVQRVVNSKDVFSLGIVNGNASGGTRFGYFSLFQSEIIVDAGINQSVCTGNNVNLTGSVRGGAVTGKWSVLNGNGSFDDAASLSTTYNPTPTDYATGSLSFVLESTGKCFTEYDTMRVTFTPGPIIDAGANVTICDNNSLLTLDATYNAVVSGVQWFTVPANPGGFSPGATSDPVTYQPTTAQLNAGSFKIYAQTVGVGSCSPVTDSLTVTVVDRPVVEAGPPLSVCANNPTATLAGSVIAYSGGGQGVWTNKGNTVNPTDNALGGTYTLTPTEITNGSVTLTLSSVNNLLCNAESDNVTITVTPAPAVNAGVDQIKCANNSEVTLNGAFTLPATGARWIGGTNTSFNPNRTTMGATYTPTSGEIATGSLDLTLESTGNGNCSAATDVITLTFTPAPTMEAGVNQTVCANNANATLNAVFANSAGVRWTNKTGSFNSTSNPVVYAPSNAEKTAGMATLFATTNGVGNCLEVTDSLILTIVSSPQVEAGTPLSSCANNPSVNLGGSVLTYQGVGTGIWSNGLGSIAPASDALTGVYTPTSSEITNGSVNLILGSTNNGICNAVSDNVTLTIGSAPTVNAGNDQTKCANNPVVQLNGNFTTPATGVTWVGGTTSSFNPSRTAPNAVYTPTSGEIASGSLTLTLQTTGNGNCLSVSDDIIITFTSAPTMEAGVNQTVCANNASATLNASFTNSAGVRWTNKTGSFNSTSNPIVYAPSNAEKTAGIATLFATTDGVGNCIEVTDSLVLTVVASPQVEAGAPLSSCANNPSVNLGGSVLTYQGVGTGIWSNGLGSIAPASDALTGVYTPTSSEITNGSVNLILGSTNNGICNAVSDNVTLTIGSAPTVNAGNDQTKCANNPVVQLNGSFTTPATGVTWVGGTTSSFNPSRTAPNAVYTPTSGEIASGSLTLTLETTGNGICNAVTDNMTITFTSAPTMEAGVNQTVCANNASATLNASFTNSAGVRWTNKTGSFNSNSNPVVYAPSNAEKTAGMATLFATTNGVGNCLEVTDSLILTIVSSPQVEAGAPLSSCANNPSVNLGGSVLTYQGVGTGIWSNGLGSIAPASDALTGVYTPTSSEITNGSVNLILGSTNNGICNAVSDNVTLTIGSAPTVNAGNDQTKCANNPVVQLNGSFTTPATGVTWVGGTTSSFNPSRTAPNAVYTPTSGEIASGSLTLTLETTGNGICNAVTDNLTITFTSSPTMEAGVNQTVCANNASATLNASFTNSAGVRWTNKTGSFNSTSNPVVYAPSNAEKTAGMATLFATTDGVGNCVEVTDSLILTIVSSPQVEAGAPLSSCANNPSVNLGGSVLTYQGVGTGAWSGFAGTISPASDALTGVYTPTSSEITNGSVNLILGSTNNGICNAVSDNVTLTIGSAPTVNAGNDQTKCANNPVVQLNGSFTTPATGVTWVGGTTSSFNPSRTAPNAVYTPTSGEIASGSLTLTLQTTGNGNCLSVSDDIIITFTSSPTMEAGVNQTVCANNASATLNASFTNSAGVRWTNKTGSFNSTSNPVVYAPSNAEKTAGMATLFATTDGVGNCLEVTDSLVLTVVASPQVEAGAPLSSCANNPSVNLGGSVLTYQGVGTGIWSNGLGSIAPASDALTGVYTPTSSEITNGSVNLILGSTNNGICNAVSDNVTLTITPAPVVDAGTDQTICSNNSTVQLAGSATNGDARWIGGSGSFSPNRDALNAVYTPTPSEVSSGSLTLTLRSTNNGLCNVVNSTMTVTFSASPSVEAGAGQVVCANNSTATLSATRSIASGVQWSGGNGLYLPNSFADNINYEPTGAEIATGQVKLYATTTGVGNCLPVTDSVIISIAASPIVEAGSALTSCENKAEVQLVGSVIPYTGLGSGTWTGGAGSISPNSDALTGIYSPTVTEVANGTVNLTLTSTNNGICNAASDNVTLTIVDAPVVNAGTDKFVCGNNPNVNLSGTVSNASGARWVGGLGVYTPNRQALNATYEPTQDEVNLGSINLTLESTGNGTCSAVQDQMTITFTSSPTVNAGNNQTVCANKPDVTLNGSFTVATGAFWNGFSGNIVSGSTTNMNATYRPSASEITNGEAVLFLTTTGNGTCNTETDSVIITITPAPTVDAGAPATVCANKATAQLQGDFTVAGGVEWSGGNGSYIPSKFSREIDYIPTSSEIASGFVNLVLQTTDNGTCNAVNDNVLISITPKPSVSAGVDQTICENNPATALNASVNLATGVQWGGGLGTFNPDNMTNNVVYNPTPAEINSGSVSLVATSTGNGLCNAVSDTMAIVFSSQPVVEAGDNKTVCANNANTFLNGQVFIATGARWKNFSGSFSPNNTTLNASYLPSAQEITAGKAVLYLESTGNGNCSSVQDSVVITITPRPTVDAGAAQTACANNSNLTLDGNFSVASGIVWSGGTGSFQPSNTDINATYVPSTSEINSGGVNLTVTTTGNGNCFAVSDNVSLSISSAPTVNAGVDQVLCANNADVQLSGALTLATGGVWSGGAGTFTPNNTSLNTLYKPTPAEIGAGLVELTLTTTGNGSCKPESDEVTISFTPAPTIEAGATQTVCANNANVTLDGAVTVATGVKWFNYSGSFSTTDTDPKAVYTPSTSEIENGFAQLTLRSTGNGSCLEVRDDLTINLSPEPFVEAGDDIFNCVDELDADLNGLVLGATTTGRWSASGTGIFIPSANDLGATYRMSPQDSVSGQVILTLTSTNNGNCIPVSDDVEVTLTNPGQAQAGSDLVSCANNSSVSLNGQVSGGAIGGTWSTSGSGQFTPSATNLNATYIPSVADTTAGTVTLSLTANSCDANTDQLVLTITDAPRVNAGNDRTVCADNLSIALDGAVWGANTTGIWTTLGSGGFQPSNTNLKGNYVASNADVNNQSVQLILTSTNVGSCIAVSDTVEFSILPTGNVFAGNDVVTCANSSDIQLFGNISGGATAGQWTTSGTGTFSPADTVPQAVYVPSITDKNSGGVKLKLTSNSCDLASDSIQVTITPAPTVDAGGDITVCENNATTPLNGQVTIATSGRWSTNGQGTFVSNTTLNTDYLPAATDSVVTIYLTSTGNGNCVPVVDSLELTIIDKPNVNAGVDQVLCDGIRKVNLKGAISQGTTSGQWFTTGTGGFDPSPVLLETSYLLSATDSVNRGVTLILQSTNNGLCNAVSDTLLVSITDVGTADAGANVTVCANDMDIELNGSIQGGATQGTWTTSGSGIFSPNANTLVGTYIPSAQDSLNGSVTLTLVSNSCDGAKSDKVVTITPAPFVEAGPDQITCVDDLRVSLDGLIAGASNTGKWATSGTGSFIPNAETINAAYQASRNDSINGLVTLTLTPSNIGNCTPVSDVLNLTITSGGTANAGADQSVCSNTSGIQLAGSFTGGATQGTWITSGTGSFVPNSTDMAARYVPSNQDIQNGLVTVTLETNSCDKARDNMVITIIPAPRVNAGNNLILCENNTDASLFGEVSGASGAVWSSTGSGSFLPSNTSLSANYKPSKTDVANDNVRLYLTSVGNGNCTPVRDSIVISFTEAPKVNVGADVNVCKSTSRFELSGVVSGATSTGKWATLGGGFFLPSDTVLTAEYVFGPADTANGFVNLVLVSSNNGNCKSEDDTLNIQLTTTTFADAGSDTEVCPEDLSVQLSGKVASGATQGTWTTNGTGTFSPSPNVLFPTYRLSPSDSLNKSVQLVLTANSGNGCSPGSDTVTIRLSRIPTVNAGADMNICPETDTAFFVGSQTNVFTQEWTSTGSGSFLLNSDTSLAVVYRLSRNDRTRSSISFVINGESQFGCQAVKDTMNVNLIDAFDVNFVTSNQCVGDATEFVDTTTTYLGEVTSWLWKFGDGEISDLQEPKHQYEAPGFYEVALVVMNGQGCVDSLKRNLTIRTSPTADFELDVIDINNIIEQTEVAFVDQSKDAAAWTWVFGLNQDTSFTQNPVYTYQEEGIYNVQLTVFNQFGCVDTLIKPVTILGNDVYPPAVPNAFTPNGDDRNNILYVRGGAFSELEFKVYNEWGGVVFETTDATIGWDGKKGGEHQPSGVYTYTVKATTIDGREYKRSGDVTLIR